jgi:hypothetical protein
MMSSSPPTSNTTPFSFMTSALSQDQSSVPPASTPKKSVSKKKKIVVSRGEMTDVDQSFPRFSSLTHPSLSFPFPYHQTPSPPPQAGSGKRGRSRNNDTSAPIPQREEAAPNIPIKLPKKNRHSSRIAAGPPPPPPPPPPRPPALPPPPPQKVYPRETSPVQLHMLKTSIYYLYVYVWDCPLPEEWKGRGGFIPIVMDIYSCNRDIVLTVCKGAYNEEYHDGPCPLDRADGSGGASKIVPGSPQEKMIVVYFNQNFSPRNVAYYVNGYNEQNGILTRVGDRTVKRAFDRMMAKYGGKKYVAPTMQQGSYDVDGDWARAGAIQFDEVEQMMVCGKKFKSLEAWKEKTKGGFRPAWIDALAFWDETHQTVIDGESCGVFGS